MPAFKNLVNSKINGYLVVGHAGTVDDAGRPRHVWRFKCDCGNEFVARSQQVKDGKRVCSKCRHYGRYKDLSGQTFGRMLVINRIGSKNADATWETKCTTCGKTFQHNTDKLKRLKYCPCMVGRGGTKHGHTQNGGHRTPTYSSWSSMMSRCYYEGATSRKHYLDKGISVCDRWHTFENFLSDMGERPEGTTIGRIDHDKNYSPDNCRWETWVEQNKDRKRNSKGQYI